ncbi:hypothetical protein [Cohnella rhizosphaerae]|uniref:hypothetical protein n=1 Tax=Cohnella rhizosphaerae TaxID=1457232 RepID=UPI0030B8C865
MNITIVAMKMRFEPNLSVNQPARGDDGRQGERIAGDGPLQMMQRRAEVVDQRRNRVVDDGRVKDNHEHADNNGEERRQQLEQRERLCLGGRGRARVCHKYSFLSE